MTTNTEQQVTDKVTQVAAETARQVAETARENTLLLRQDIGYLQRSFDSLSKDLKENYTTKDQFDPIKRIVYGAVGTILVSFLLAIIGLVIILQRR